MRRFGRRQFLKIVAAGSAAAASLALVSACRKNGITRKRYPVRLGGWIFNESLDPGEWIQENTKLGYSAAYCPVEADAAPELVQAYKTAAGQAGLVIAEVGAWSNPISPIEKDRKDAFDHCCKQLDLADRIGALCCVNIAGSRNPDRWDGPHENNLTQETFDVIVEVTRKIIDTVQPACTYWALETMPWIFPDSVDAYMKLIKAIDRKAFAVHLDPVNMTNCPDRFFKNGDMLRYAFKELGPYIKSCHAKDIRMEEGFPVALQECRPGLGSLDYAVYLNEVSRLPQQPPLMIEHLETPEEYAAAAEYIRRVAGKSKLDIATI